MLTGKGSPIAEGSRVYVDQFIWIHLARANTDSTHPAFKLLTNLRALKRANAITVPLSATHYLELWNRRSYSSREAVGDLMIELSDFTTLSAIHTVRQTEVSDAVLSWVRTGNPHENDDTRVSILGRGAEHAFGSVSGRFRFVESVANETVAEGPAAAEPQDFIHLRSALSFDKWQRFNLIGIPALYQFEDNGFDLRPLHRLGNAFASEHNHLRDHWDLSADPSLLFRLLANWSLEGLREEISIAFSGAGDDPNRYFTGPTAGAAFLSAIPTENVRLNLLYDLHQDPGYLFKQHDQADIDSLALAVPYCDFVFTERHWAHHLAKSGLAGEYSTVVPAGVDEMNRALTTRLT